MFIPGGIWHAVINLDDTIAVTQNVMTHYCFEKVWKSARCERPKFSKMFLERLRQNVANVLFSSLSYMKELFIWTKLMITRWATNIANSLFQCHSLLHLPRLHLRLPHLRLLLNHKIKVTKIKSIQKKTKINVRIRTVVAEVETGRKGALDQLRNLSLYSESLVVVLD